MPDIETRYSTVRALVGQALLVLVLAGCAGGGSERMTPAELKHSIEDGSTLVVVDVRSRREYDRGHVPGAIHVPFYAVWSRHTELEIRKGAPIVVYCEHGPRAGLAAFGFRSLGYEQVRYLEGHMSAWKALGYPLQAGSP